MSAEVMLVLLAEPDSAARLSDWLAEADLPRGWYEMPVDLVGGTAPYRGRREQVRGRRPRVRFEVLVSRADAARLGAAIASRFGSSDAVIVLAQEIVPLVGE
ncbi:MAG: DUF3240 family protein [Gammaproteobacteria bacterium]|nr:DUF3240 family protein [Gammaproteobacteria bacterium]